MRIIIELDLTPMELTLAAAVLARDARTLNACGIRSYDTRVEPGKAGR